MPSNTLTQRIQFRKKYALVYFCKDDASIYIQKYREIKDKQDLGKKDIMIV